MRWIYELGGVQIRWKVIQGMGKLQVLLLYYKLLSSIKFHFTTNQQSPWIPLKFSPLHMLLNVMTCITSQAVYQGMAGSTWVFLLTFVCDLVSMPHRFSDCLLKNVPRITLSYVMLYLGETTLIYIELDWGKKPSIVHLLMSWYACLRSSGPRLRSTGPIFDLKWCTVPISTEYTGKRWKP